MTNPVDPPQVEGVAYAPRIVIFISGDFTLLENGSHIRMAEQIAFARKHFDDVTVYSHRAHFPYPWDAASLQRFARQFPTVELVLESAPGHLRLATRLKNVALALWPSRARQILALSLPRASPRYRAIRADSRTVLWLNFIDGCTILNGMPPRVIVETHDIRFVRSAKASRSPAYALRVIGKMRSELAMLEQASAAILISPTDATVFNALIPDLHSFYVPTYVTDVQQIPEMSVATFDLLFVGADNSFNVEGIVAFISAHAELLTRRTLAIAGWVCLAPEVRARVRDLPHVTLLGFVDDLAPVFASARLVISPVDGTGLKIKVVAALAHGKVVVASLHSREALPPGYEACVLPLTDPDIDTLLDDPLRLAAAEAAVRVYYRKFTETGDRAALIAHLRQPPAA